MKQETDSRHVVWCYMVIIQKLQININDETDRSYDNDLRPSSSKTSFLAVFLPNNEINSHKITLPGTQFQLLKESIDFYEIQCGYYAIRGQP